MSNFANPLAPQLPTAPSATVLSDFSLAFYGFKNSVLFLLKFSLCFLVKPFDITLHPPTFSS